MIVILIILCVIAGLVVYTMIAGLVFKFLWKHTDMTGKDDCVFLATFWPFVLVALPVYYLVVRPLRQIFKKVSGS